MANQRSSNIELLRILSMIMITLGHFTYRWMEIYPTNDLLSPRHIIYGSMIGVIGIGLSCFMLISGYFSVGKYEHRWEGILKTRHTVIFYCVLTYIIALFAFKTSNCSIVGAFFPIITCQYWYISLFVIIMILQPYLSKMLDALAYREQLLLAVMIYVIECVGLTLKQCGIGGLPILISSYFGNFIAVFIIGNLLAKTDIHKIKIWRPIMCFAILASFVIIIPVLFDWCGYKTGNIAIANASVWILFQTSPITVAASIPLFIILCKANIRNSRVINTLGKSSLICYLLTESKNIPKYIYYRFGQYIQKEMSTMHYLFYLFMVVIITFLISCLIDIIRIAIFGRIDDVLCKYEVNCVRKLFLKRDKSV